MPDENMIRDILTEPDREISCRRRSDERRLQRAREDGMRASGVAILLGLALTSLGTALAGPARPGAGALALRRAADTYRVFEVQNRAGAAVAGAIAGGTIGGIIASQAYPPTYPYPHYQPYLVYPGNSLIALL
jgi:hypothetical protein